MPKWRRSTPRSPLSRMRQHLLPSLLPLPPPPVQNLLSPQSIHFLKVGGGSWDLPKVPRLNKHANRMPS